jgi:2,6-dihydroxypseudooxynicotine hydrolase
MDEWYYAFIRFARMHEKAADAAEVGAIKASHYLKAVVSYHIAQLPITEDNEKKITAYGSSAAAYMKGAKFYWCPVERVEYPYMKTKLSGFIQKPPGVKEKLPCMVIANGIDASAEAEGHVVCNYFLRKGFMTFQMYLPGQYEARLDGLAMTHDFEKPTSAALDYLVTRSDVDINKIALIGISFGGFIAPRVAAFEKRVKACISIGGFYGLDEFEFAPFTVAHCLNDMKITLEQWPETRKKYNLDNVIDKITCPLLVVNGKADTVLPISQTIKIYDNAHCPKDLKLYDGCDHSAWFNRRDALVDSADWAWVKLHVKE